MKTQGTTNAAETQFSIQYYAQEWKFPIERSISSDWIRIAFFASPNLLQRIQTENVYQI